MTNTELAAIGLNTPSITLTPSIRVASGKGFKQVQFFGQGSARQIKESLKAKNPELKGKALSRAINNVLTGEKSLREQLGVAFVQATIQAGFIPDSGTVGKNTANLRFIKVKEVEMQSVEADYENMSADEINALLHRLEGLLDNKVVQMEQAK